MLKAAPGTFARILGVPVVHASHAGRFVGQLWPGEAVPYPSHYLGETQIVDGRGAVLARMSHEKGEGVITASLSLGPVSGEQLPIPDRFWIPEFSDGLHRQWENALKSGHEYYLSTTLLYVQRRFARPAGKRKLK